MIYLLMSNNVHDNNIFLGIRHNEHSFVKHLPIAHVPSPAIGANMCKEDVIDLRNYLNAILGE